MTRPANTLPLRLARHRALAFAEIVDLIVKSIPLVELTILGSAGMSDQQIEAEQQMNRDRLSRLAQALRGSHRGPYRKAVTVYYLPREGIELFKLSAKWLNVSPKMRPLAKGLAQAAERKHPGPPLYTGHQLELRLRGQFNDPRQRRRYSARLKREVQREQYRDEWKAEQARRPGEEYSILTGWQPKQGMSPEMFAICVGMIGF